MKTPYLIQRGQIKRPLGDFRDQRLSKAVALDYMGSSEFEFGALPKSFREIEKVVDKANLRVIPEIKDKEGKSLRVFSVLTDEEWIQYLPYLHKMREGKLHCKECVRFEASREPSKYSNCDFWWDIENHVMWSFDKSFMNSIHEYVAASLNFMNEQKRLNEQTKD
jgi:hypothetical protein